MLQSQLSHVLADVAIIDEKSPISAEYRVIDKTQDTGTFYNILILYINIFIHIILAKPPKVGDQKLIFGIYEKKFSKKNLSISAKSSNKSAKK